VKANLKIAIVTSIYDICIGRQDNEESINRSKNE